MNEVITVQEYIVNDEIIRLIHQVNSVYPDNPPEKNAEIVKIAYALQSNNTDLPLHEQLINILGSMTTTPSGRYMWYKSTEFTAFCAGLRTKLNKANMTVTDLVRKVAMNRKYKHFKPTLDGRGLLVKAIYEHMTPITENV